MQLIDEVQNVHASRDELEIVRPQKRDRVVILRGDNKGQCGQVMNIDIDIDIDR